MWKKRLKWGLGILAVLLVVGGLAVYNSFHGNPISHAFATKRIEAYRAEHYPSPEYEVSRTGYDFKIGAYYAVVQSTDSVDTHFTLYDGEDGIQDYYEDEVASGWNTYMRLENEYAAVVEPLIEENLPYEYDMVITALDGRDEGTIKALPLDQPLDFANLPLDASVTLYIYSEELSWEKVAEVGLALDALLREAGHTVATYDIVLEPVSAKEQPGGETLGVYDFSAQLLRSDDLPAVMQRHFADWEEKMNQM